MCSNMLVYYLQQDIFYNKLTEVVQMNTMQQSQNNAVNVTKSKRQYFSNSWMMSNCAEGQNQVQGDREEENFFGEEGDKR